MEATSNNVRVCVRFRPLLDNEDAKYTKDGSWKPSNEWTLDFDSKGPNTCKVQLGKRIAENVFAFDNVFRPGVPQEEVYKLCAEPVVKDVLTGYNGTIFAYGQTGSGKSFTMFGSDRNDPVAKGIIPRATSAIFDHIASDLSGTEYTLQVSFLEVYMEKVRDLLNPAQDNLQIREHPIRGMYVENLTEEFCSCEKDVYDLLTIGEQSRAVASTRMNSQSSRSHSVFAIIVTQKDPKDGSTKSGRLNLVDLAGSEKVGKTGATGETLEQAKTINQSLSALGNVISALVDTNRTHVPYRDSKLTRILQESLGGNTKTTLIVAASPHEYNAEETVSSLRFGQRAKSIKTQARINKVLSPEQLMAIIEELRAEIARLKRQIRRLQDPNAPLEEGEEADGDYNPVALARTKLELDTLRAEMTDKIESLEGQLQEATEKEAEQARYVEVLEEKARAGEILKRKFQHRSSVAEAEAEAEARRTLQSLLKCQHELTQVKGEATELAAREEALMAVAEDQEEELQKAQAECAEVRRSLEVATSDLAVSREEGERLKASLAQAEGTVLERTGKLEATAARLAETSAELARSQEACARADEAATTLRARLADSAAEVSRLGEEVADGARREAELSRGLAESREAAAAHAEAMDRAVADLKAQAQRATDAAREEHARLSSELAAATAEGARKEAALGERGAALEALTQRHAERVAEVEQLQRELAERDAELARSRAEASDLRAQLDRRAAEARDLAASLEATRKERDDAQQARLATAKEGEVAQMQLQASLQRQVDEAREEAQRLRASIADAEAEGKRARDESAQRQAALDAQGQRLQETAAQLAEARASAAALGAELGEWKAKHGVAVADLAQRDGAVADLQASVQALTGERDASRAEAAAAARAADAARAEAERAHAQQLSEARAERDRVAAELRESHQEVKRAQLEVSDLQGKVKIGAGKLDLAQGEADRFQAQVSELRQELDAAKHAAELATRQKDQELNAAEELRAATVKTYNSQISELKKQLGDVTVEAKKFQQLSESLKSQVLIEKSRASTQEKLAVDTTAQFAELEGKVLTSQTQLALRTRELDDLRSETGLSLRKAEEEKAALRENVRRLETMLANYKNASVIRKPLTKTVEESTLLAAFRARLNHEGLKDDLNEIDSPAKREIMLLRARAMQAEGKLDIPAAEEHK